MSSAAQIEKWCESRVPGAWLGVFSSDTLPSKVPRNERWALVANYDPKDKPGSHWIAMTGQHKRAYYFSSYALKPDEADPLLNDTTHFRDWLNKVAPKGWIRNKVPLQSYDKGSDACGEYSCWAAVNGGPLQNPEKWSWASSDRKRNDRIVKALVKF